MPSARALVEAGPSTRWAARPTVRPMSGLDALWAVAEWLPAVFALDLLLFHLVGDHPLAARWWWGRPGSLRSRPMELL